MRRWILVVAVLAVTGSALFALPPTASADDSATGSVRLEGAGVLVAAGDGLAVLDGRMNFHGTARAGALLVKDKAGDAHVRVEGYGRKIELAGGGLVYLGFHGRAHILGSDVRVAVVGEDVRIHVVGEGTAFLKGRGWYRVNGRPAQPWSAEGTTMEIAA
jgi:hypothetical protein